MSKKTLTMRPYKAVIGSLLVLALIVVACGKQIAMREAVIKKGHFGARSRGAYERAIWLYHDNKTDDLRALYLMDRIFDLPSGQRVRVLRQTANGLVELEALDHPYEGERWWASEKAIEITIGESP